MHLAVTFELDLDNLFLLLFTDAKVSHKLFYLHLQIRARFCLLTDTLESLIFFHLEDKFRDVLESYSQLVVLIEDVFTPCQIDLLV